MYGHPEVVALLLAAGAPVDVRDTAGWTSLHYASSHGQPEVVRQLILQGADRHAENKDGQPPVELTNNPEIHTLFNPPVKAASNSY